MIAKNDLIKWLKQIDNKLNQKITLVAVGGTALTLLGIKLSTVDVDFCLSGKETDIFRKLVSGNKFKVDIFQDGFIFSEQLPEDYATNSIIINAGLKNIDLRALSLEDIVITKAARYNERDEEDISAIAQTKKISKDLLKERFKQVVETYAGRTEDYISNFEFIIKRHFRD